MVRRFSAFGCDECAKVGGALVILRILRETPDPQAPRELLPCSFFINSMVNLLHNVRCTFSGTSTMQSRRTSLMIFRSSANFKVSRCGGAIFPHS